MANTSTGPARHERIAIYFDGKPHPDFVVQSGRLRVKTISDAKQLETELADSAVEGIIADEAAVDAGLLELIRRVRLSRPELELLCCADDIGVLERIGREFDGFVLRGEDILEFSDSVRMVLDRCCARRRHGAKKCKHTHESAGRA